MEKEAQEQYNLLSVDELLELNFTGSWEYDKKRFLKEYSKNQEIFNADGDF